MPQNTLDPRHRWTLDRTILAATLMMAIAITVNVEHAEPLWLAKIGMAILWLGVGLGFREEIASINFHGKSALPDQETDRE